MTIISNYHYYPILHWWDLTPKEQKEFNNYDATENDFVRYQGWVYDLSEFERTEKDGDIKDWDSFHADTYCSAVLMRYVRDPDYPDDESMIDYDHVQMGLYLS
jgi:hypothetical protein